jgi:hypothetical protein
MLPEVKDTQEKAEWNLILLLCPLPALSGCQFWDIIRNSTEGG